MRGILLTAVFTFATTNDPASPDYCGSGRLVEIIVSVPSACDGATQCFPNGSRELGYSELCVTYSISCTRTVIERWTDYPECGGHRIADDSGR